jgi:hypothetical protein
MQEDEMACRRIAVCAVAAGGPARTIRAEDPWSFAGPIEVQLRWTPFS